MIAIELLQTTRQAMKDLRASLETLRANAAEASLIRDLATDFNKRELYARLAEHLRTLADEVEAALAKLGTQESI